MTACDFVINVEPFLTRYSKLYFYEWSHQGIQPSCHRHIKYLIFDICACVFKRNTLLKALKCGDNMGTQVLKIALRRNYFWENEHVEPSISLSFLVKYLLNFQIHDKWNIKVSVLITNLFSTCVQNFPHIQFYNWASELSLTRWIRKSVDN